EVGQGSHRYHRGCDPRRRAADGPGRHESRGGDRRLVRLAARDSKGEPAGFVVRRRDTLVAYRQDSRKENPMAATTDRMLYVGTGPATIFKSSDRGDTWTELEEMKKLPTTKEWTFPNPPHVAHVKGMALCADDPALIYGSVEEGWCARSRDGGKSWDNLTEGIHFDL